MLLIYLFNNFFFIVGCLVGVDVGFGELILEENDINVFWVLFNGDV